MRFGASYMNQKLHWIGKKISVQNVISDSIGILCSIINKRRGRTDRQTGVIFPLRIKVSLTRGGSRYLSLGNNTKLSAIISIYHTVLLLKLLSMQLFHETYEMFKNSVTQQNETDADRRRKIDRTSSGRRHLQFYIIDMIDNP